MGNRQTRRYKNRIEPLQQVSAVPTSADINNFDIENVFIIWLEIPINNRTNHDDSVQLRHRLRQVFPRIQSFCSFQKCLNHIMNAKLNHDQRFILIFSGSIIRRQVMTFYNIPSIAFIYFCVYSENHLSYNWIHSNNDKIRGVFHKTDLLYDQLVNDLQLSNNKELQSLPITVFSNDGIETSTHIINADYLWLQLLIELIISMYHTEQAKEQMVNECRLAYEKNETELKKIENFRSTYTSDQAIKWYTTDSFVYRLLNRVLRYRQNFDNVFKFRYFIADLHRQLKKMQGNFKATTVYRGQMMSKYELNMFKENRGKCISVNTFLSTTLDEEVARSYAGNGEERPKVESVLFVIHIDDSVINTKPFAFLKDNTHFNDEEEVLFSIGSVFEISEHINLIPDTNAWRIDLKLSNIQNQHVINLMNCFMDEIYYEVKDIVLGKFLIYMGKYEEAVSYFKGIYNQYANGDQNLFYLFDLIMGLGLAFHSQTNYNQAEELYMIALKHREYQTNLNYLKCQNQFGKLCSDKGNYDLAAFQFDCVMCSLKNYKQKNQKKYHLLLAETCINIVSLQLEADTNYEFESEKVFKLLCLAKEIYEKILPANHPFFAELHYYFGWAYFVEDNNNSRVLENLQHAMNIQVLSLPKNHIQRVQIHFRLGEFYFAQKQYPEGLKEFGKIVDIHFEILDELHMNHPLIARTYMNIGDYYQEINRLLQAFQYFRLALALNPNEKLKGCLEFKIVVCTMIIKNQMDTFDMNSLFKSLRENNHDIKQQEILFYQDENENILDMASDLRSTDVHFSNFGTKLSFDKPLTLQQMKTLCDFIRNGSDVQHLVFFRGVCESEVGLIYLADALTINDTIKELDIFQSSFRPQKISKNACQVFANAIKANQTLTHLSLNDFSNPQMTLLLFDALSNYNQTLAELRISKIKVSNKAAQHLGEMLKRSKVITKIFLEHGKLTSSGSEFIASGLEINESLTCLHLSYNKIQSNGFRALGNALKLNKTLSTLYLNKNGIHSSGVQSIGEALSINRSLKILHLDNNYIDCVGATYIANGLKTNETLTILSLKSNRISSVGATALWDSLRINKTLSDFDISQNSRLLSSAAFTFAEPIHLTVLNLEWIGLRDDELQFLVNGLVSSTKLHELQLTGNKLSADGCIYIEQLLKNNDTLNELALSYNKLTDIGLKYICEGLAMNKSLKTIHLDSCIFTDHGMDYISEMLKKNKVLTQLSILENDITEAGIAVIKESLKFNRILERLAMNNFEIKEKDRYSELDKNQLEIAKAKEGIDYIKSFAERTQMERRRLFTTQSENTSNDLLIDNTSSSSVKYIYNENGLCTKHIINDYDSSFLEDGDTLLHKHFLYRKQILKDGNNCFRTISDCIHGNDNYSDFYRQFAIDYVKANPDEFYEHAWCFNPSLSVDDYLVKMADSTKPADQLLIRSICQQMNVNLVVHTPLAERVFFCVNQNNRDGKQLHLYTSDFGKYFDSVHSYMQPDETLTNIFISPDECTEGSLMFLLRFA